MITLETQDRIHPLQNPHDPEKKPMEWVIFEHLNSELINTYMDETGAKYQIPASYAHNPFLCAELADRVMNEKGHISKIPENVLTASMQIAATENYKDMYDKNKCDVYTEHFDVPPTIGAIALAQFKKSTTEAFVISNLLVSAYNDYKAGLSA